MTSTTSATVRKSVWKHGIAAAVVAAAVTTGLAYIASQAGVSFVDPAKPELPIPMSGFAVLTAGFSLIGVALAAILARTARRPRAAFVWTTVVLTVLSIVPDFVAIPKLSPDFDAATSWTLAALHVVAAAIVIPVLAGRLADER
ncbi:MAG TPA: DUF6069 family protein [Aeromicrobium sp.]|nr:DUF6069 family protein [Aeromicrobium sp.]HKY58214.1 DUF6069 family protein [Aeromicrobium sp.]